MIKEAFLGKMRNFIIMITEWYLESLVIAQLRPGLFEGRVLKILGPQWKNVTGVVLGYHISIDEGSGLLGYEAVSIGNELSVF